jgi:TPP-dependent pyruvate/acetoin dehydrogenase alpha subunit
MTNARKQTTRHTDELSTHNGFSLISNEKLLELYSTMLKCRMLDERIEALGKRNVSTVPWAAIAGTVVDLAATDTLAPSHGAFAPCLAKGLAPAAMFGGTSRPPYAALGLVPPSLRATQQIERVLRAAAAGKRRKQIAVIFLGESCDLSGELGRAFAKAGKKKLPILFVCQSSADSEDIAPKMKDYDFPGVIVDRDDAVAVYRVATESIAHARRGNGPTLIECKPWPLPGKGSGKRKPADAIRNMEAYLTRKGLFSRKYKMQIAAAFRRELDAATKEYSR